MGEFKQFEDYIFEAMSKTGLPGLSAAVVSGDGILWCRGFGFRDVEAGLPATPNTVYGTGSITKSFTAIAVLQLQEEGKLSLDDPVGKHLPLDLEIKGESVRIWHLLAHAAGIPALAYAEAFIRSVTGASTNWAPTATPEDIMTFMRGGEDWALESPGKRWFYLNEGYVLLGKIVELVSGLPYEEYVRERILTPLGLESACFLGDIEASPEPAAPYIIGEERERRRAQLPKGPVSADGGLAMSVLDLARYAMMFLNRDGGVLSKGSVKEMEEPRVPVPYRGPFGEEAYGYGLWIIPDFLGVQVIGHGGSVLVYTAYMAYAPKEGVGVALLANGSGPRMAHLGLYGLALALGKDPEELPFVRYGRLLERISGVYEAF
ncbi:TPA: class A beta-lactamase-related serine hydrolase, partial [Candidatus Micrarchaeota archaeon]|nr:class A beta-lactamase-related serine hydrolase [Candidatus Micrarchaeota archaeon]